MNLIVLKMKIHSWMLIICQEPYELREEEVDITKNVIVLDEEEALVTYDDKELEEERRTSLKRPYMISLKDVYDPAILGKILIHCHFFVFLFISLFIPSFIHLSPLSIHPSFFLSNHLFIHLSFYSSIYSFILLSYFFHLFINSSSLILGCPPPTPEQIDKLKQSFGHSIFKLQV